MILKIGTTDFSNYVSALKVEKNYLTSEYSGRNAAGTMSIDVIANKYKITASFITLPVATTKTILSAISGYANLSITFMDPFTNTTQTKTCYIGTPSIEYYRLSNNMKMTKPFSINFIEL